MAFNVQNDAGSIPDANAYVDVAFLIDYHTTRNFIIDDQYETEEMEAAIIKATEHIDLNNEDKFSGDRLTTDQTTAVPRKDFYNKSGKLVEGIHVDFKKSTCEYAKSVLLSDSDELNPDLEYDPTGQNIKKTSEEVVGAIKESVEYKDDYILTTERKYPKADSYLKPYLTNSSGGSSYSFLRA